MVPKQGRANGCLLFCLAARLASAESLAPAPAPSPAAGAASPAALSIGVSLSTGASASVRTAPAFAVEVVSCKEGAATETHPDIDMQAGYITPLLLSTPVSGITSQACTGSLVTCGSPRCFQCPGCRACRAQQRCAEPKQGQSVLYELQVNSSGGYLLTLASSAGGDADLYCLPGGSLYNAYGPPSATEYAWNSGALASIPRLW